MKANIQKLWKNDIFQRAIKTFIQGFLACVLLTIADADLTNITVLKSLALGGVAAGLSATMNYIKTLIK